MEKRLLTNPEIVPETIVFQYALKKTYPVFEKLFADLTEKEIGMNHEWRYYNDGKAWLCKVQFKKKTVFWLSIWESCFKVSFYFLERHLDGFYQLPVHTELKEQLRQAKPAGKLFPLTLTLSKMSQLKDLMQIIDYKKTLS